MGILDLNRITSQETRNEKINSLIEAYALFLLDKISLELWVDSKGYVSGEKILNNKSLFAYLETIYEKYRKEKNVDYNLYFLITSDILTKNDPPVVIKYNPGRSDLKCWIELLDSNIEKYYLVHVLRNEKS